MNRANRVVLLSLIIVLTSGNLRAAQPWIKLTSSHFELYTTAGEKKGRDAIQRMEQVRGFFVTLGQTLPPSSDRVRLIGFDSSKEFQPYSPGKDSTSFSFGDSNRDTIVLRSLDDDVYRNAVFNYVSLLLRHSDQQLPLWLKIGLAELYSTLKPVAGQVQIGEIIEAHREALDREKPIDLPALFGVDYKSSLYTDRDKSQVLYGESWALVHMLMLSDRYAPRYPDLMRALRSGMSQEEALQKTFGKPLNKMQDELFGYLRGEWFKVVYFDTKLVKPSEPPQVQPASPVEAGLVLVSLLHQPEKKQDAQAALAKLAQEHPGSWEIAEAQGYFDWQRQNNPESARKHLDDAAQMGSTNPRLYYDLAMLSRKAGDEDGSVIQLLQKAVALDPEFQEARITLATLLYNDHLYAQAIAAYAPVTEVNHTEVSHEEAERLYGILTYSYHALKQDENARKAAEKLLEVSETAAEITSAKQLIAMVSQAPAPPSVSDRVRQQMRTEAQEEQSYAEGPAPQESSTRPTSRAAADPNARPILQRRAAPQSEFVERTEQGPPTTRIEGTLQQFDCLGSVARLTVLAAGKRVVLAILDPTIITITGRGNGTLDFSCGRQQPLPLVIEFENKSDPKLGTTGVIKSIEFK